MTDSTPATAPTGQQADPPALAAPPPALTEEQREQLRAWHESLGCRCIASIETVPCCIDYLLDGQGD